MPDKSNNPFKFWEEIKRRKVHRVLAIYAGTAFIILEAVDITFPRLGLPDWSVNLILYLLILGSIITVIVSWIYDITPEGIIKTDETHDNSDDASITEKSKKRQNISNAIIAALIIIVGILLYPKLFKNSNSPLGGTTNSSIAVLPLKIIGEQEGLDYLASGLVESLTHMLSKAGNSKQTFTVIPSSEILETITAGEARKKFGVSLVISGSIQMDHRSNRLILNLINAKTQSLIRSEKIDYTDEKNLIIQDKAISVMTSMLGFELETEAMNLITRGGSNLKYANELYLTGRGIFREGIETQEDIDMALDLFLSAIKQDSLFAKAFAGAAQAYTLKYHFTLDSFWNNESIKYSRKAVHLNDQDPYALISLAASLVEQGEYEEALSYYEKSKSIDSTEANIYSELAYLYEMTGEIEKAEQNYRKAIELDPDSHLTHYYLGGFYYAQSRIEEAILAFNKALEFSPGHLTIMHAQAACYFELGRFEESRKIFSEILEHDREQGQVLWGMGNIDYYQGNPEKSVFYYKEALQLMPNNYSIYAAIGRAFYVMEDTDQANIYFRKAIIHALENPVYSLNGNVATYYAILGMRDSSYYYLTRCDIPDDPLDIDPADAYMYGELYLILGEQNKAYSLMGSALKRNYGWTDVKYSPFLNDYRKNPGFQTMLSNVNKTTY